MNTHIFQNLRWFFTHRSSLAVGLIFASDSMLFGSWVSHIPFAKEKLGLNDAELGFALLWMSAGLLAMNPISALILKKIGTAQAVVLAVVTLSFSMMLPTNAPTVGWLIVGLFGFGLGGSLCNIGMNTLATAIERAENRPIMSACHGMWSLGGMLGAATTALMYWLNVPPGWHMVGLCLAVLGLLFWLKPTISAIHFQKMDGSEGGGSTFIRPGRDLLLMIFIGIIVSLCEGVAFDWSAVYLRDVAHSTPEIAALGFAFFAFTMMLARFVGDVAIPKIGEKRALFGGAIVAATGILVAVCLPFPATTLVGWLILGAGVAWGAPILYAASSRLPGLAPGAGLATFATFSFVGFLSGPPLLGFVSEKMGLPFSISLVAGLALISLLAIRKVRL